MIAKRRAKAKSGSFVDNLRKKSRQTFHDLTQDQKDRRNELCREKYKDPNYKFGKDYVREKSNSYYLENKEYLDKKRLKQAREKTLEKMIQIITLGFYTKVLIELIAKSSSECKKRLKRKQNTMRKTINEHMYKIECKNKSKKLAQMVASQYGLTADEIKNIVKNL